MTQDHYDYRLRVNIPRTQAEAKTLKFLKSAGRGAQPEGYRVALALQAFYGTEAAIAENGTARETALESIGLLLEQCVVIAEQTGIDLDSLACDPAVLNDLLKQAAERLDPLRRSRRRVSVKESGSTAASNGKATVAETPRAVASRTAPPVVNQEPETTQAPPTTPPPTSRPKRERMF